MNVKVSATAATIKMQFLVRYSRVFSFYRNGSTMREENNENEPQKHQRAKLQFQISMDTLIHDRAHSIAFALLL